MTYLVAQIVSFSGSVKGLQGVALLHKNLPVNSQFGAVRSSLSKTQSPFGIIGGSCHKYYFCRDKHVFVVCLSRQNTSFVVSLFCLLGGGRETTVRWTNFSADKHIVTASNEA